MPKPANLIPSQQLNLALPLPLYLKVTEHLYSELEGRVPHGAFTRFFSELLRSHFEDEQLDLAPWLGQDIPGNTYLVRGNPVTVAALRKTLE